MRRVVVTGFGVVSPIGNGKEAFFEGLHTARSGIDVIRSFEASTFPSRVAGQVKDLDLEKIALPEQERAALLRDPRSIFGILAAREALRQAFAKELPTAAYQSRRIGVFLATGLDTIHLDELAPHVGKDAISATTLMDQAYASPPRSYLHVPSHLGALCVAREAGASGPFCVNVSAGAAGTQALGTAFDAIRDGLVDVAIAGGYDSMLDPLCLGAFGMLDDVCHNTNHWSEASRPFDIDRAGIVLGEGSGVCILEERQMALARGATELAEILGYCSTMDPYHLLDTSNDASPLAITMQRALHRARLLPDAIDYINAHGAGTRSSDVLETRAIRTVFGHVANRLPVSSTKSQTGHLVGAAGAVEFLAGMFALLEQTLPATLNLTNADPDCDLDYVPMAPRAAKVTTFMSNSFALGGQNAVIIAGIPRK